ncbi:MAG: response regulator, partial [Nitrospiraceae bacterium]
DIPKGQIHTGTETILVVEDKPDVRTLVCRILRENGYTVYEARHGIEALLLDRAHTQTVHLLLTDVIMPQMSGPEVANQLKAVHPDLRVIYMSGYTDDAVVRHGVSEKGTHFLEKPFAPEALLQTVRGALDCSVTGSS